LANSQIDQELLKSIQGLQYVNSIYKTK